MKTLSFSIITIIVIASVFILSTYIIFNPLIHPHKIAIVGYVRANQTDTSTSVSNIVIPAGAEVPNSGKNYEPRYLVIVLGVNNTVRWINESPSAAHAIVAENQDDPLFWNVTRSVNGVLLLPDKSFNFTFTKVGEFQYDTEPHPWMYGWVLVLPQSAENAVQTVVLNDSGNIPDPCEVFQIPCPLDVAHHNLTFTAQKLGTNIYLEKITGNGVDYYAVIHNSTICTFSTNFGGTCSNPDDLAILQFIGVDTSIPKQETNISITGLHLQYLVGEPIEFGIHIGGYGPCGFPSISVLHGTSVVWKGKSGAVSCPSKMVRLSEIYDSDSLGGPFYLNQSGTYTIHVEYGSNMTEERFNVISQEGSGAMQLIYPNGTYTGFSVNYGITGDNKLLGATLDNKTGTIILSTHTTGNGNLTLTLEPDLVNLLERGKYENLPIVLVDGQEVKYKEHLSNQSMIMTIPFYGNVKKIEIAGVEVV
ncbi:MAG TPA: hypothetical protein VJ771_02200 [Candidatus Nitrosotalea sp.]|nr:hypothetical protein [Candidatus Nitrosotalea sp.]